MRDADTGQIISGARVRASHRSEDCSDKTSLHPFVALPLGDDFVYTLVAPKSADQGEYALIASHPSYRTKAVLWCFEEDVAEHGSVQIHISLKPAR